MHHIYDFEFMFMHLSTVLYHLSSRGIRDDYVHVPNQFLLHTCIENDKISFVVNITLQDIYKRRCKKDRMFIIKNAITKFVSCHQ